MNRIIILLACVGVLGLSSCNGFLDVKPDSSLALVKTVDDYLAIVQNETRMNANYPFSYDYASDFFYLSEQNIDALDETGRYAYLWIAEPCHANNWNQNYVRIYDTNVVLQGIDHAELGNRTESDRKMAKGLAAFSKGFTLMQLAALYAPPYERGNNMGKLGIPIRPSANIEEKSVRPSLDDCYKEMERLLIMASNLLPEYTKAKTISNQEAAWAALARFYLVTQNYEKAFAYADSCLQFNGELIDYNLLDPMASGTQFPILNKEVVFHATKGDFSGISSSSRAVVDNLLYNKYAVDDLRKSLFYRKNVDGVVGFYGSYDGNVSSAVFSGIARDEIYLIAAECAARLGKLDTAVDRINALREKRIAKGSFTVYNSKDPDNVLRFVLEERERELSFRAGIRWMDLRRLNLEERFKKKIIRSYKGKVYTLEPNDVRYTFKIPDEIVSIGKLEQNQ
ncbi:RagB/SusD family nutrient uptake outer membrane protein [Sphingobacterium faecale]|uniref:RagB/SusD family nutrient uptake outer membrane protein n=1 Tax=Sphingobacterium faecale TaxID=2803775 RepID=A0ABS1QYM9_9SPHI|nr:RagB/SusD family nutrient uptake outer membrane protein [Sphingobacterium faecale]MBL1407536.1 RagB/SusD family nutrient uptake outer membrane protein [Sphingobacterium faecale]